MARQRHEIITIASQVEHLTALGAVIQRAGPRPYSLHKPLLDMRGRQPFLSDIYHRRTACHLGTPSSLCRLSRGEIDSEKPGVATKISHQRCREFGADSDYPMKAPGSKGGPGCAKAMEHLAVISSQRRLPRRYYRFCQFGERK